MPQLLVAYLAETALVASGVLATGVAASVIAGTIVYGTMLVASLGYSALARRRLQRSADVSLQDRMVPVRASDAPRTIVYGETRVAGVLTYAAVHGSKREKLSIVYSLAGHEIDSFSAYWLNDAAATVDADGNVTSSPWAQTADVAYTEGWTGGAAGSTFTLTTADALVSVDTVAVWSDADVGGEGASIGRVSSVITDWTVNLSTKTITLTTDAYSGKALTATCRVSHSDSYLQVKGFNGLTTSERDIELETYTASDDAPWTSAHVQNGVPRLRLTHTWNESAYATGLPTPTAIVRGKRVYDPRADSTNGGSGSQRLATPSTWTWSRNPALCAADYLMDTLGFGVASSTINWASVRTAANICDEDVPAWVNGFLVTQTRYTCDGVLSTDATRKANMESLLACMVGSAYFSGGQWYLRAAAYVVPDLDLDESDLASESVSVRARAPRSELFNAVRGRYRNPNALYQVTDFPPYASSTYAAEDGETIYEDIDLGMVDNWIRAQRIAKLILYRARQALIVTASFKLPALVLQPGDTCRLTIARYGWSNKVFRVIECEFADAASVRLTLQEEASAIYAWSYTEATNPDPAPNTALPPPSFVAPPFGVTVTSSPSSFYLRSDNTAVPYIDLAWAEPPPDISPHLYWKRAAQSEYERIVLPPGSTSCRIEGVSGGETLNLYVVNVAPTGARSVIYWIPAYVVDADLPANGAPAGALSANLLSNATIEFSVQLLTAYGVRTQGTFSVWKEYAYPIAGAPSNFRLQIDDQRAGTIDAYVGLLWPRVPIDPTRRYVAFCSLIGWGTGAHVAIVYYDAADNMLGQSIGNLISAVATESVTRRPDNLQHYEVSSVFSSSMPSAARYARLLVVGTSGWLAGTKYVFGTKPFFGQVPASVNELPPWDAGGSNIANTGTIAAGAATEVVAAGGAASGTFSAGQTMLRIAGPAIAGAVDGSIELSCTFSMQLTARSDAAVAITGRVEPPALPKGSLVSSLRTLDTIAAGTSTIVRAFELTSMTTISAGSTVTPELVLTRVSIEPPSSSGIVEKTVPVSDAIFNSTDRAYSINWRVTYIKR